MRTKELSQRGKSAHKVENFRRKVCPALFALFCLAMPLSQRSFRKRAVHSSCQPRFRMRVHEFRMRVHEHRARAHRLLIRRQIALAKGNRCERRSFWPLIFGESPATFYCEKVLMTPATFHRIILITKCNNACNIYNFISVCEFLKREGGYRSYA